MITREELLKSSEYWTEIIQNKIFNELVEYIEGNNISNEQLREILGVSKGRISQILSGNNLNFRIDSLVRLCLVINKVPDFQLVDINDFIRKDEEGSTSQVFKEIKYLQKSTGEMLWYSPDIKNKITNLPTDRPTWLNSDKSADDNMILKIKAA
jgi:predicted XRE-type DNA-binding protein